MNQITLYLNGQATSVVSIWKGGATSSGKGKETIPVVPGDMLSVRIELGKGSGSITRPRVSVELMMSSQIPWLNNGGDMYYPVGGRVGIGTDSPSESLSVNGTIESITGGIRFPDGTLQTTAFTGPGEPPIPSGSVIAFGGPFAPAGWLLCEGSLVDRAAYPDLFAAIGTAHGAGDGSTTFALPDYRGRFLRGVTGSSSADPEADLRLAMSPGGNAGNAVGSSQGSEVGAHLHGMGFGSGDSTTMVVGGGSTSRLASFIKDEWTSPVKPHTDLSAGKESRPVNAYVNFLIKS
jgi:microcystin-dependent protein